MKKNTLVTPEGKSFTFNIPDESTPDTRGFYKTDTPHVRKANKHIEWDYLTHDLKHRGLNADHDFYERNGVRLPNLEYSTKLLRDPIKSKSDDWQETAHHWLIIIGGEMFNYYTGLAHRTAKPFSRAKVTFNELRHKTLTPYGLNTLLDSSMAKPPSLEDVLYALIMDADACTISFHEWCDNFGYDNDSLKARNTYDACQETADKLYKAGVQVTAELKLYFEDY